MKIIKVTTEKEWRSDKTSGSEKYETLYMVKGIFKKTVYWISQQFAIPVVNISALPTTEDQPEEEEGEKKDV